MNARLPLVFVLLVTAAVWSDQAVAGGKKLVCDTLAEVGQIISANNSIRLDDLQKLMHRLDGRTVQPFDESSCEAGGVHLQAYRNGAGVTYSMDSPVRCSFWIEDKSGSLMLPTCWSSQSL